MQTARAVTVDSAGRPHLKWAEPEPAGCGQSGGGRRPYGYDHDRVTVRADEAEIITELMRRRLAGESVVGLARELNERGVPTSTGGRWRTHLVTRLLCSARIAGCRERESREHATQACGAEFRSEAEWPAIVTRAEVEQVRALSGSHRRTGSPGTYLLSGLARCGRCRRLMGATARTGGKPIYLCVKQSDGSRSGCGTVSVQVEPADTIIVDTLREFLGRDALVDRVTRTCHREPDRELGPGVARHTGQAELLRDRLIAPKEYPDPPERIVTRAEATASASRRRAGLAALDGFTGPGVFDEAWESASPDRRRAIVQAVTASIVVHPATVRGSRAFDADRIEWLWRVQP